MGNKIDRKVYEESATQHQRLLEGADAVLAKWPHDIEEANRRRPYLIEALRELKAKILAHFQHEETPEYLSSALHDVPRFATRAQALVRQHPQLVARLDEQLAVIGEPGHGAAQLAGERETLQKLIHDLRQHEQAEDELLLKAVNDEVGTGD
jgi:Hemerythrin HHE cation binding domain